MQERNGQTLLRFLFYLNKNPKKNRLFLLGDIFDFWLSDGSAFQNAYKSLIDEIARFKQAGGEVVYFEGNHDLHIDVFWTKKLDIPVYVDAEYFEIDGLQVRMEHGDFINADDKAYLKYRATIRHPWVEPIGHIVPSRFWKWFGERQSQRSRKKTSRYAIENSEKVITLIRSHAMRAFDVKNFDLIVTGHMHIYDDYEFQVGAKKVRSINLGTWLEFPRALKIEDGICEEVRLEDFLRDEKF
jgi:UDP-2,3-diacylglucosamine hydrolase